MLAVATRSPYGRKWGQCPTYTDASCEHIVVQPTKIEAFGKADYHYGTAWQIPAFSIDQYFCDSPY
jgi:hypothetical protein